MGAFNLSRVPRAISPRTAAPRKYSMKNTPDSRRVRGAGSCGRGSGAMYIRAVAGDFGQIYDNGMHLGRPISLPPGGPQSRSLLFAPAHSRSRLESGSGRSGRSANVWLEARDRSAPITRRSPVRIPDEFNRRRSRQQFPLELFPLLFAIARLFRCSPV